MATKTTVDHKGVTSVRGAAVDELKFGPGLKFVKSVQAAGAASANVTSAVTVFEGSVAGITGTLPTIAAANVGESHEILNANVAFPIMVTGSDKINGAVLGIGYTLSGSLGVNSVAGKAFTAVSTSAGFQWVSH